MSKSITVYSKPDCRQCDFTKKWLDRAGVEYRVIDISLPENAEVLEAAQGDNEACDANVHEATVSLRTYVVIREAAAKETADREALEGLARKLYNADRSACDLIWEDLSPGSKKRWVDRMKKAREIIEAKS